ncbi:MAG: 3-hydroxyacyl-CoA dehydrogenase [Alphaproteobacteria bacterium]|nr:3-hydroxyacyl-CoA dehydrogenase [Alphaproteobacteria bacterium]
MKAVDSPDFRVGVVGAGAMGQGIAQVSLTGGMPVVLFDAQEGGAAAGAEKVFGRLDRMVEKGRLAEADVGPTKARLAVAESLEAFADCDVVIEAVFEDLEVKRSLFQQLEAIVRPDCLIATNTSSLPIASIARVCERRDRIAGMHFFNPVPVMKLVEIISGPETNAEAAAILSALGKRMGRVPVEVKDSPGFLVNLGGRAFTTEGLRIQQEGVAAPAQIDAVCRDCGHFRMGPFELMDLTGIDVNYPVSQIVCAEFQHDPRLRTTPHHKLLYEAGRFGRKTAAGHYRYDGSGNMVDPPSPDHEPDAAPAAQMVVAEVNEALVALLSEAGVSILAADDGTAPIVAAPLGEDSTTFAARTDADHRRLVCIDTTADTSKRITVMTAPGADPASRDAVAAALVGTGRKVTAIQDSPGFIAQRIRAMIANLGCEIAQMGLAAPKDIDLALQLGLNYPLGPLEIAEDLGVKETLSIMQHLQAITGDDRYRPSLWLRRRALLGLPIHTAG